MDPLSPGLLIAWAVLAVVSVLGLGGCVPHAGSGPVLYQPLYYAAPPPPYYTSPPTRSYQPSVSCITVGSFTSCS